MEKLSVCFFIEDKAVLLSLEEILPNLHNGRIGRQLLNTSREINFPVFEKNNKYFIDNSRNILMQFSNENQQRFIPLQHGELFSTIEQGESYQFLILSHSYLSVKMKKVTLPVNGTITLGRSEQSNIVIDLNDNISRCHARIHIISNEASIEDTSGKAGIYVNGKKVIAANLKCGDTVMIMGYTILYMKRFLMIPETVFAINGLNTFSRFEEVKKSERNTMVEFERNPRIYKSLITDKIEIDPPPQKKEKKQQPFILTAGPSLTMSLAMMMQLGIAVSRMKETGNIASVASNGAMAVSLLAAAVLWPLLSRNYYQKQEKKEELYRRKKYVSYLEEKEELIKAYQHHNRWVWNTDYYPEISDMIKFVENKSRRLWEKSPTDQDFMSVRLGKGTRKSELQICVPERHFSLYDDDLLDLLYKIEDVNKELDDFPVVLSFLEQRITGVVGDQERIKKMIWCMIVNLVAMHSPDEVKIGFVGDQSQIGDFEWMIQLPHLWSDDGSIRFFVTKNEEANEMLRFFYDKSQETDAENAVPQYVIFVLNEKIIENSPLGINRWLKLNLKNMSFVYAAEYFSRIPKEAEAIILNDCERTGIYRKNQDNNQLIEFVPDELNYLQIKQMMRSFSYLKQQKKGHITGIPEKISFLNMYQAGNVKVLEIKRRWMDNKVSRSMAAPIGMKANGEIFSLDIHEKYHGCHGLVAGMTGSGKSEFLQEFILSLMINYSPEKVAFILIDFKGGDMARPFLKAPHLSATISNLSGNMLYRARVSLEAEIQKRQRLFNKVSQELGVDKLDINSWHKYADEGKINNKLPHLIIIIDEFAQLKTQQPEFLDYLINVAQVGRSLGIHLILATQKPSGVVSPQIWSNSRFKVCLKVLDREDSKEMLHRSEAAAIKFPGRAFVQVGYDEIFEEIQTGYSGADYVASERYLQAGEDSVELLDYPGKIQRTAKRRIMGEKNGKTQLEETISEIIKIGKELNLCANHLWKPLLKEKIYLEECLDKKVSFDPADWDTDYEGRAICGYCDLPQLQKQEPYAVELIKNGHVAIYGMSGTGKTLFLQTFVLAMALKYSPNMLQIYGIDFGGRTLGNLEEMPHCGGVAFADNKDKIEQIIEKIKGQMELRKRIFAENECNTYASYLEVTGRKLPMILLLIDNYSVFRERMYKLEEDIIELAANAKTYGIFLVLTGNSRNAIYYKISEHIGTKIVFQLNDSQSYRELLNSRSSLEIEGIRGRALIRQDDMIAEMQVALPFETINEAQMYAKIKQIYRKMNLYMPKETEEERERKEVFVEQSVIEVKKNVSPVFDCERKEGQFVEIGYALYDGRVQGFSLSDTKRIFLGSEKKCEYLFLKKNSFTDIKCYYFSLNKLSELKDWVWISSEKMINEFIDEMDKNHTSKLLYIDDFSNFYDTISDEDLSILGKRLKTAQDDLTVITAGNFARLKEYQDTGLYVQLVRCRDGMIVGGDIDNQKVAMLGNELSQSNPNLRKEVLEKSQAILYRGSELSYITLKETEE